MNGEIILTKHGGKRIKERCGIKKKGVERMAMLSQQRGIERALVGGALRKWMDEKSLKCSDSKCKIWLYGEKIFIFSRMNVLITVLQVPTTLKKRAVAAQKGYKKS